MADHRLAMMWVRVPRAPNLTAIFENGIMSYRKGVRMRVENHKTEDYILEQEEKAKFRNEILGTHKASTKAKLSSGKVKGKSGRMKTFYLDKNHPSFQAYLNEEIGLDELKRIQGIG